MKINVQIRHDNIIVPYSTDDINKIDEMNKNAIYIVDFGKTDTRSLQQNKSIHLWCKQIANTLNSENFFIQDIIKLNTKWDMIKVKELLFKPVVKSLYTKDSTTKLNKDEFDLVIDTLVKIMANKGVVLPEFPNREKQ